MDLQAVLILLLIAVIVLGVVKRLFKLVFVVAVIGLLFFLANTMF